jgi:hypothetical protein
MSGLGTLSCGPSGHRVPEGLAPASGSVRDVQHVLRSNDEAPPRPDGSCGHESRVLCEGELLGGTEEIRGARQDNTPFHDRSPGRFENVSTSC